MAAHQSDAQRVIHYGVLDTRDNIHHWLGARSIFKQLMFRNCDIAPFKDNFERDAVVRRGFILCFGRMLGELGSEAPSTEVLRCARILLTGEVLTPVDAVDYELDKTAAQNAFCTAISVLRTGTNINQISQTSKAGYIAQGGTEAEWDQDPLKLATAVKIMDYIDTCSLTNAPPNPVAMLALAFVALSKRGTVSDEFCTKIVTGIKQDTQTTVTLSPDLVRMMWTYYGEVLDDIVAKNIFARWKDELPANALRLRITLDQTLNTGLTTLVVTVRGLTDHPMFPRDRLMKLTPYNSEMNALKKAIEIVGDNQYYGYRKDLGDAKGTLYKNLSWVAKELLIKVNGESALLRYAGFPRSPAQRPIVTGMVDNYINILNQYGTYPDRNPLPSACEDPLYRVIYDLRQAYSVIYQVAYTQ